MLSLKCKVNFSVAESKLIMKMLMCISSLLEKNKEYITHCLQWVGAGEKEGIFIFCVCFLSPNSILK